MIIKYISHSGFYVESEGYGILIDPWFFSSEVSNPVVQGMLPTSREVSFQIPPTKERIELFHPQMVLLSQLSATNSPLRELRTLAEKSRNRLTIAYPSAGRNEDVNVQMQFADLSSQVLLQPVERRQSFEQGPFRITALTHTIPMFRAWFIECTNGSFLHVTDSLMNQDTSSRTLDKNWADFQNLRPSFLAISGAGVALRARNGSEPYLVENACLSPVEAARIASWIKPKSSALMCNSRRSVWEGTHFFQHPPEFLDSQFSWAMEYLAPETRTFQLKPGMTFETGVVTPDRAFVNLV